MLDLGYGDDFEREEADRADTHAELARDLLLADVVRFCPSCGFDTLVSRRNPICRFCDGPTKPSSQTPGAAASGARGDDRKEAA
jgi:hypothetical protein